MENQFYTLSLEYDIDSCISQVYTFGFSNIGMSCICAGRYLPSLSVDGNVNYRSISLNVHHEYVHRTTLFAMYIHGCNRSYCVTVHCLFTDDPTTVYRQTIAQLHRTANRSNLRYFEHMLHCTYAYCIPLRSQSIQHRQEVAIKKKYRQ